MQNFLEISKQKNMHIFGGEKKSKTGLILILLLLKLPHKQKCYMYEIFYY